MAEQSTEDRIEQAKRQVAPSEGAQTRGEGSERPVEHVDGLPAGTPPSVSRAARGEAIDGEEERGAVAWLLEPQRAHRFKVTVQFEADAGTMPLIFVIRQIDSKKIDEVEKRNLIAETGRINQVVANSELVAEATLQLEDPTGGVIDPKSEAFRSGVPSTAIAFEQRFMWQAGLLSGVAGEIRRIAGWSPDRVGTAQRVLTEVAGN